jgi:osmotically-inducible protein OsmY
MKKSMLAWTILLTAMAFAGCSESRKTTLGLDVNLYLHPTSADPVDIILQTAITKRLNESSVTKLSLIHVRVEDKAVTLTGTAKADVRDEAERIARETEMTLNGESIRPRDPITNKIVTN